MNNSLTGIALALSLAITGCNSTSPETSGQSLVSAAPMAQLAQTPPLGWNSFNSYGVYLHEKAALENLEAFAEKLQPHGYEYFVIDAGWYGEFELRPGTLFPAEKHAEEVNLDEYGLLEPSQTYFPGGMTPIIDRAHELGVKFGLHMMRGIPRKAVELNLPIKGTKYRARDIADTSSTCGWNNQNYGVDMTKPGAQEYYDSVYQKLADWGVDLLKVDDLTHYPKEIAAIKNAIAKTGRPIVYSLSPGGSTNTKDFSHYLNANMLRVTHDIWDEQASIERSFEVWRDWQGMARPGFWPDLDMLPFGPLQLMNPAGDSAKDEGTVALAGKGHTRMSEFNQEQMRTFMTQRSLFASPIMMGGDLPTLDAYSLEIITNKDMLACNQTGISATLVKEEDGIEVWGSTTPAVQIQGCMGIFNRSNEVKTISLSKEWLDFREFYQNDYSLTRKGKSKYNRVYKNAFNVKDVWGEKTYLIDNQTITVQVKPNDVLFLVYEEQL
ncbi:glycoside hydrolase family 27 protein [Colwellia piezophila]|uniref:glycoside hydrolase family 27 protein n=1 Tax=Colwellia piezophila TaxID=211668 RepID=UPI00036EE5BB|nr:glycoside hydrolase family 27 protein [Colwellia piezophila]